MPAAQRVGLGHLDSKTGTDPAADTEILETIPNNRRWLIRLIKLVLVTDAGVADRTVTVQFKDAAGNILTSVTAGTVQTASQTVTYHIAPWITKPADVGGSDIYMDLPLDFFLAEFWQYLTVTTNRQATDNFGAPIAVVEEFGEA
jgi:hypothetical protein